jgi:hypothetical protein
MCLRRSLVLSGTSRQSMGKKWDRVVRDVGPRPERLLPNRPASVWAYRKFPTPIYTAYRSGEGSGKGSGVEILPFLDKAVACCVEYHVECYGYIQDPQYMCILCMRL